MSSLVPANEKFKFEYSSFEYTDASRLFLKLATEYHTINPIQDELPAQGLDLLFEVDSEEYLSLQAVRQCVPKNLLSTYLDPLFKEAEYAGITSLLHFRVWIQGNHEQLRYPCNQLDAHTHLDGDLNDNRVINTHTVIIPISINDAVNEYFWAKWIDEVEHTLTPKLKILSSMDISALSKDVRVPAFSEWWNRLEQIRNDEVVVPFPKKGQKLTLDFNSRNNLHGIKNIGNNLYLIALFDRCKR
jgi:hypothetical protein